MLLDPAELDIDVAAFPVALAADLVQRHVSVIFATDGTASVFAAKPASPAIPIVFLAAVDPVAAGLVCSLNRPGGNLTGISGLRTVLAAKRALY